MKLLLVTASVANFANGVLKLTPNQARAREHALKDLGDGFFEVLHPVSFKRGEIVGFDSEVNKALLQEVDAVEEKQSEGTDEDDGDKPKASKAPRGGRRKG